MRTIVILAAMLAALAVAPPPVEAGDRGFGFRHSSPHPGAKFHRPHHRFEFHRQGVFGKHRHLRPRHFGHSGLVLKFSDGNFAFKFGHVPRFEPRHFHHRHRHGGVVLRFGQPSHLKTWSHRSPRWTHFR